MNIPWLDSETPLPAPEFAEKIGSPLAGLVAAGGGLSVPRLCEAYKEGIFPWFSESQPVLWWSPDPRMVLKIDNFKLHRKGEHLTSLNKELEQGFNQHAESGYHPKRHTGILTADIKSPLDTPSAVDERYISGYDSNGYVKPEAHYNKELGAWVVPSP